MITLKRQSSIVANGLVVLVGGLLGIVVYGWIEQALVGFVWPFAPWHGWLGTIAYTIVWVYAFLIWGFCWIAARFLWLTPILTLVFMVELIRARKRLKVKAYEKILTFQARHLSKSWRGSLFGFGKQQTSALMGVVHAALESDIKIRDIERWILTGLSQGMDDFSGFVAQYKLKISYPKNSDELAVLPELSLSEV